MYSIYVIAEDDSYRHWDPTAGTVADSCIGESKWFSKQQGSGHEAGQNGGGRDHERWHKAVRW